MPTVVSTQKIKMQQKVAGGWNVLHPETEVAQITDLSTTLSDYLLKNFSTFTQKTALANNDLFAINDSEASGAVKKVTFQTLQAALQDSHNKGYYATPQALSTAIPSGQAGDFAIVGSTDTIWVWDSDNSQWVDTDTHGEVTSVNGQTGAVTIPTPGTLQTDATTAQTPSASEALSGNIVLHKVAKTGSYNDLLDKPSIPGSIVGDLISNNTTALTPQATESFANTINVHRIAKTANFKHLLNAAGNAASVRQIVVALTEPNDLETGDFWYEILT